MPHLRLPMFVALTFALLFVPLAHATEKPFQVFAATGGVTLGPGESVSFPVLITRNSETCTVCSPNSTTCCTGVIQLSFENIPAGVTPCFVGPGSQCLTKISTDSAVLALTADSSIAPGHLQAPRGRQGQRWPQSADAGR